MAHQTLTPAERDEMLQTLARLLPSAVLDAWEEIHLRYASVVDASTMECTVVRVDGTMVRVNPSYKVVRLLPELRAGMYQPARARGSRCGSCSTRRASTRWSSTTTPSRSSTSRCSRAAMPATSTGSRGSRCSCRSGCGRN